MSKLERYLKCKKSVENAERQVLQDQGAYNQSLEQLKQFGFSNLNDAKRERDKVAREAKEAEIAFQKALKQFGKKWSGRI